MGKLKTHKASAKRFRYTAGGKIKINHMGRRHKTGLKATKRKRILRKAGYISSTRMHDLKRLLPYA